MGAKQDTLQFPSGTVTLGAHDGVGMTAQTSPAEASCFPSKAGFPDAKSVTVYMNQPTVSCLADLAAWDHH